jgi:UDP-N-acetylmuramoylalanine--D-glutamate ligase
MKPLHPHSLRNRPVLVMGLGSFGGGLGTARYLAKLGAKVTVTDLRSADELAKSVDALADFNLQFALGGHHEDLFTKHEVVVVNPAVPRHSSWLKIARQHGCTLTSEVELALTQCATVPAAAITGTHGKSTTAALLAHLVSGLPGKTVLAGNLGGSLLEKTAGLTADDRLVVELSSFQLDGLQTPASWPEVGILTCLRQDHLDWHGSFEAYAKAKQQLFLSQSANGLTLLPQEEGVESWAKLSPAKVGWTHSAWEPSGVAVAELPFSEPYRRNQIQAAVETALHWGVNEDEVISRLKDFGGLPHRMAKLSAPDGYCILDNGVATHPEPTAEALNHLAGPVVLLAGGKDKDLDLALLAEAAGACVAVHLFGNGGKRLADQIVPRGGVVIFHPTAGTAMDAALHQLEPGQTLLFSPSFSSFDEFSNFQQRAQLFGGKCQNFRADRKRSL